MDKFFKEADIRNFDYITIVKPKYGYNCMMITDNGRLTTQCPNESVLNAISEIYRHGFTGQWCDRNDIIINGTTYMKMFDFCRSK